MNNIKAGDVVLGAFATRDGSVLNHYSVVLDVQGGVAALAYTTSMKVCAERNRPANMFSTEDMRQANWTKPCLWDASTISLTPVGAVRKVGRITQTTLQQIVVGVSRARQSRTLATNRVS